jgi:hypothetical protein
MRRKQNRRKPNVSIGTIGRTVMAFVLAGALCLVGAAPAFADPAVPYWEAPEAAAVVDSDLLTTFGVRDGSAGPDFLGISNTNFDFTGGQAASPLQYTGYTAATLGTVAGGSGLAIWATSVNEEPNPYYQNLYYNAINPSGATTQATTWMSNPVGSWGDSNASPSNKGNVPTGVATIAGLEFDPDIIFGANRITNWQNALPNGTNSQTVLSSYFANNPWLNYGPVWTSNDATNIWSQIYTLDQLAQVAQGLKAANPTKETRYSNNAITEAVNYEKNIRGNLRYIASQIDAGATDQKTVAYLYSIDENDVGYFFTPAVKGLLTGDDTGKAPTTVTTPDANYAANNATIDMGYMATLPFITNTYASGIEFAGGIIMGVGGIYKANPACIVTSQDPLALAGVDVLIYNTTILRGTGLIGSQQGRNDSGIDINVNYDATYVAAWASAHGFAGAYLAGDDFSTSFDQGYGTANTTPEGMSPLLYCQRNYTADKNARAAWAFAQVYPGLYGGNPDATYAYWVDKVYHINLADVPTVVTYMTNKDGSVPVIYTQATANALDVNFAAGLSWWDTTGRYDPYWSDFAYYNGSSRASYYSGDPTSEEPANVIGIFAP